MAATADMIRRIAKRAGLSERDVRKVYEAMIVEWKVSLASLEEVRFPNLGKLKPRLGDASDSRTPVYPTCEMCSDGVSATPQHLKQKHGMTWAEYKSQFGGSVTWRESIKQRRVYVSFVMYRAVKRSLIHCGPLPQILEDERA